jgi:hypothetical protein
MTKKILISCGPIPGKLDSVKYITNRFKGGLAFKTAETLASFQLQGESEYDITIIKWRYTEYDNKMRLNVVNIDDIYQYYDYVVNNEFDVYILAAAVANLIPSNPWEGKFPSHNYKVGEKFNIEFTIAPRAIDEVKKRYPKCTLIGYKLFDGNEQALIDAGYETLVHSKANCVFCNHPSTAKSEKIALLPDGSIHKMDWNEHIQFIRRILQLRWFSTEVKELDPVDEKTSSKLKKLLDIVKVKKGDYEFGTVATFIDNQLITTSRGKKGNLFVRNESINNDELKIVGQKMTLNAPILNYLIGNREGHIVIHGHRKLNGVKTIPYYFDGTDELVWAVYDLFSDYDDFTTEIPELFNVDTHGYYATFPNYEAAELFIKKEYGLEHI